VVLAVFASGVLGMLHKSVLYQTIEPWVNIHVLFGTLLTSFVVLRFHWSMTPTVLASPSETYAHYRQLKRMVYLLLYGIIAIRQLIGLVTSNWDGNAFDFDIAAFRPTSDPHHFGFDPTNESHAFLACGAVGVAVVHLLMIGISRGGSKQEPVASVLSTLNYNVAFSTTRTAVQATSALTGAAGRANGASQT